MLVSDNKNRSILSAFVIEDCPNDIAFYCLFDNLVDFIEENLVSLLLAVRGYLVLRLFNDCFFLLFFIFLSLIDVDIRSHTAL